MPRPLRIQYPGAVYHVISRGNERKNIFRLDDDYELFLDLLKDCSEKFDFLIHAYCLMPNHIHLLLETKDSNLSNAMKRLLGVYTMRFNRKHKRYGHLFQGRYKAFIIDKDSYFLELSRYIHLNPTRAKLIHKPEDYKYSSLRFFLSGKAPDFLYREFTLKSFDSSADYLRFVKERISPDSPAFKRPIGGLFIGSQKFVDQFRKQIQNHQNRDFSGKRDLFKVPPDKLDLYLKKKDTNFQIYCLWKFSRLRQKEIGNRFSITDSAVSHAIKRAEARLIKDKTLRTELSELQSSIFRD